MNAYMGKNRDEILLVYSIWLENKFFFLNKLNCFMLHTVFRWGEFEVPHCMINAASSSFALPAPA